MWLILSAGPDASAAWAAERLRARFGDDVRHVTQEELAGAVQWHHWLEGEEIGFTATLRDGRLLDSRDVSGTLNRVVQSQPAHLALATPGDREYAEQEFGALVLSALACLRGPLLNPPTPQGLGGAWRHTAEWVARAAAAGLPTEPYRLSSEGPTDPGGGWQRLPTPGRERLRTWVVGSRVLGAPLPSLEAGCRSLAQAVETPLLGIEFETDGDRVTFHTAHPMPDLVAGGEALADALADALAIGAEVAA